MIRWGMEEGELNLSAVPAVRFPTFKNKIEYYTVIFEKLKFQQY